MNLKKEKTANTFVHKNLKNPNNNARNANKQKNSSQKMEK
jgi:hypothetical protein